MANGPYDDSCWSAADFRELIHALSEGRGCVVADDDMLVTEASPGFFAVNAGTAIVPGVDGSYLVCFEEPKTIEQVPGADRIDCIVVNFDGTCEYLVGTASAPPAVADTAIKLAEVEISAGGIAQLSDARTVCGAIEACVSSTEFAGPQNIAVAVVPEAARQLAGCCTFTFRRPMRLVTNPTTAPVVVVDRIVLAGTTGQYEYTHGTVPPQVADWPLGADTIQVTADFASSTFLSAASSQVVLGATGVEVPVVAVADQGAAGFTGMHCVFALPC